MVKLGRLAAQEGFDVAHTPPVGQLREGHAKILTQASKVLDLVLAVVTRHTALKRILPQICAVTCAKTSLPVFMNTPRNPVGRTGNATRDVQIETSLEH